MAEYLERFYDMLSKGKELSEFDKQRLKNMYDKMQFKTVGSSFNYVEPLDFNLDSVSNKIVYPYEDYSISVNLEVQIPRRNSCGDGVDTVLYASSDNGTINFFGGSNGGYSNTSNESDNKDFEKGYLSTSWTDISANNVDKGNRECLGIESINITYNQNFFPIVNIRFVDVRGASLFMPQENAYREAVKRDKNSTLSIEGGSFFKALFSCPSPIFKLTIKGFYGYSTTYKLMWSKFTSDFDSETGNFIANVDFAGYLYGIYTDLPMAYISLAPYTDEGSKYWKEQVENGRFVFSNNHEIETFPKFYETLQIYNKYLQGIVPSNFEGRKLLSLQDRTNGLIKLLNTYPFKNWKNSKNNEYYFVEYTNSYGNDIEIKDIQKDIIDYKETIDGLYGEYPSYFGKYETMFSGILKQCHFDEEFDLGNIQFNGNGNFNMLNNKTTGHVVPECYIFTTNVDTLTTDKKIESCVKVSSEDLLNPQKLTNFYNGMLLNSDGSVILMPTEMQDKIEEFGITIDDKHSKYIYCHVLKTNFVEEVKKDLEELKKELELEESKIYEEKEEELENLVGFNPTIENMFKMVYAHIETFMHVYYLYLADIKNEQNKNNRTLSAFNISKETLADVPDSFFEKIPPFPNFVRREQKHNRYVLQWPKDIIGKDISETNLVKTLHKAVEQYNKDVEDAKKNIENFSPYKTEEDVNTSLLLPFTPYDIVSKTNPYEQCIRDVNETKGGSVKHLINMILYIFLMRCYYFALIYREVRTFRNSNSHEMPGIKSLKDGYDIFKYIGGIEAANLFKALGELNTPTDFWEILSSMIGGNGKDKDKAFKELVHGSDPNHKNAIFSSNNENKVEFIGDLPFEKYWYGIGYQNKVEDGKLLAIPIKDYSIAEKAEEIKRDDFVYIKTDNTPITDSDINDGFAKIFEDKAFFTNIVDGIKTDKDFQKSVGTDESFNEFIEDFFTKFIGGYLVDEQDEESKIAYNRTETYCDPYFYDENKDFSNGVGNSIFSSKALDGETSSFVDIIKLNEEQLNYTLKTNNKFYVSFINNHPCIDTINVISSGCTSEDCLSHFILPEKKNISLESLITSSATSYDKAFLFLFTLPITKNYSYSSLSNNGKSIAKSVLLREGAYYYWKENYEEIKSHFSETYFNRMGAENVPIVKVPETLDKNIKAPTLYVQKTIGEVEFFTWEEINGVETLPALTSSRKNCLINYFKEWVDKYFEDLNQEVSEKEADEDEIDSAPKVILNTNKYYSLMKIMAKTSVYFDASDIIDLKKGIDFTEYGTFYYGYLQRAFEEFAKNVSEEYKKRDIDVITGSENLLDKEDKLNSNFYLSTYNTLQNLYNRHIAGSKMNRWVIGASGCDFNDFFFLDCYYTDIGDSIKVSGKALGELLSRFVASSENNTSVDSSFSVYQYLSLLCQKCEMNLIALPVNPYKLKMEDAFKPKSFGKDSEEEPDDGCFIALYTYPNSQHLDIEDSEGLYGYKNDSFLIVDNNGNLSSELPIALRDADKKIPAFGVTYARQNQCFFTKINVSSSNPQVTAPSIQAQLDISRRANDGPNETISYGQDLYSVYSNHSYTCEVEMLGCAQIMPMMYFQLNNIPMFRGVYMVIKVEHNIVAGNMTTKFTGVRMNKYALPLIEKSTLFKKTGEFMGEGDNIGFVKEPDYEARYVDNPDLDELENRKQAIAWAFEQTFSCVRPGSVNGETKSMCARYTYNMAFAYKKGETPCIRGSEGSISAGGNAKDEHYYWDNLKKLGYAMQFKKTFETKEEIKNKIIEIEKSSGFSYGDVLVYWANVGNLSDNCAKYGHTQIYIGDAKIDECPCGWASSMKNNYDKGKGEGGRFVYSGRSDIFKQWTLVIFKANGEVIQ